MDIQQISSLCQDFIHYINKIKKKIESTHRPVPEVPHPAVEVRRVADERGHVPGGRNVKVRAPIERIPRDAVALRPVQIGLVKGRRLEVVLRWGVRVGLVNVHRLRGRGDAWGLRGGDKLIDPRLITFSGWAQSIDSGPGVFRIGSGDFLCLLSDSLRVGITQEGTQKFINLDSILD